MAEEPGLYIHMKEKFQKWQRYVSDEAQSEYALQMSETWFRQNKEGRRFKMLLIGETGSGKSTLINNFVGEKVATEGHQAESETSAVKKYSQIINGVNLDIYDSPGQQGSYGEAEDQKHMRELKESLEISQVSLVIFCYDISNRKLNGPAIKTFRTYHELDIPWEKTIFAITFANDTKADTAEVKVKKHKEHISTFLKVDLKLSDETVDTIAFCPTGHNPKAPLVNYSRGEKYDWFIHLWFTALECLDPESIIQLLHLRHGDGRKEQAIGKDALAHLVSMYKGEWKYRWRKILVKILEFIRILDEDKGTHQTDEPQPPQQGEQEDGLENNHDIDALPV